MNAPEGWNIHHLFWMRRDYKDSVGRTFRNQKGLMIPTPVDLHRNLHANLSPPPKPRRDLMLGAISVLSDYSGSDRLYGLNSMIDYFDSKSQPEAPRIAEHLIEQLGYLTLIGEGHEIQEMAA